MIADEGDEELADGLVEVLTQRGLVLPTPAEAKFGGEHLRWLVERIEELAADHPLAWSVTAQLLEAGFDGTNEAVLAAILASGD